MQLQKSADPTLEVFLVSMMNSGPIKIGAKTRGNPFTMAECFSSLPAKVGMSEQVYPFIEADSASEQAGHPI